MDFNEHASLGYEAPADVADYLRRIEAYDEAARIERAGIAGQSFLGIGAKYGITGHRFGYIAPDEPTRIYSIGSIAPDEGLVGTALKVTLDKFYIEEYPGLGKHTLLLEVFGRNQAGADTEELRFTTVVEARDKDGAGVSGLPLFTGLRAPPDGIAFKVATVSLRSTGDAFIIETLKSGTFQSGLKLLGHVQPALPQLVSLAAGVTSHIMHRRNNKQVQAFQLGLDFSGNATACPLRFGSYVAAQAPDDGSWDWADWTFDTQTQSIRSKNDGQIAPYNFMIFGVSPSAGTEPQAVTFGAKKTPMLTPPKPAARRRKRVDDELARASGA